MENLENLTIVEKEEEIFKELENEKAYDINVEDINLGAEKTIEEVFKEIEENEKEEELLFKKGKEHGMKIMLENIIDIMYKKGYSDAIQEFGL